MGRWRRIFPKGISRGCLILAQDVDLLGGWRRALEVVEQLAEIRADLGAEAGQLMFKLPADQQQGRAALSSALQRLDAKRRCFFDLALPCCDHSQGQLCLGMAHRRDEHAFWV